MSAPESDRREALIRDAFEAFNRGEIEAVTAFLHPDIVAHVSGQLMNAGTWRGHAGFFEMVAAWGEAFAKTRYEFLEAEHLDDEVTLARVRQASVGRASGVPVEMEPWYLIGFTGSRARRFEIHPDRETALESHRAGTD